MSAFIKNSLFLGGYTSLVLPLGYLIRIIYANHLSVTEFGLFFSILSFFSVISVFNDLGFSETQSYFLPRYLAQRQLSKVKSAIVAALINQVLTTTFFMASLWFLAPLLETYLFKVPGSADFFRLMTIYFVLSDFLSNLRIIFYSYQEAHIYGSTEPVRLVLTLVFLFAYFYFLPTAPLAAVIFSWLTVYAVMVPLYIGIFLRRHGNVFKQKLHPLKEIYHDFLPFMIPVAFKNGADIVLGNISLIMLTYFKGVQAVALYNVAQPLANVLMLFMNPVISLLTPILITHQVNQTQAQLKNLIRTSLIFSSAILWPVVIVLMLYAADLVTYIFGSKFSAGAITLQGFAFFMWLLVMNNLLDNIVASLGMPKQKMTIVYIGAVVQVVTGFIFIPFFSSVGAVMSGIFTYSVMMVLNWRLITAKLPVFIPSAEIAKILVLTAGFAVLNWMFHAWLPFVSMPLFKIALSSGLALLVYGIGCYIWIPDMGELKVLLWRKRKF